MSAIPAAAGIGPPSPGGGRRHAVAAVTFLAGAAALNATYLLWNCPLDLAGDEAHYWEWARRPDICYYSKGPLVAWLIAASRALLAQPSSALVGSEMLAVRLPAVALACLTGWGIFILARDVLTDSRRALAAVLLAAAVPIFAAGSVLMTIDAPLLSAWTWTLVLLGRAARSGRWRYWMGAGALIAVGLLAKLTMALIYPAFGLALLACRGMRPWLRRPHPYVCSLVGLLGLLPQAWWNSQHGWVTLRHVAWQAGVAGGAHLHPAGPLEYLAGQFAVCGVVWFGIMGIAAIEVWRRGPSPPRMVPYPGGLRFLSLAALTPWAGFLILSLIARTQPNWPAVAIAPGVILAVDWLANRLGHPGRAVRRTARLLIAMGTATGVGTAVLSRHMDWVYPLLEPLTRNAPPWDLTPIARYDPAARLRGWRMLGHAVGDVLRAERQAGRDPFLIADHYQLASQIAFYCPGHPDTYSLQAALGGRHSQYDVWPNPIDNPAAFVGRPCIYVGRQHPRLTGEGGGAAAMQGLRLVRTVEHVVRGQRVQVWPIYVADAWRGLGPAPSAAY